MVLPLKIIAHVACSWTPVLSHRTSVWTPRKCWFARPLVLATVSAGTAGKLRTSRLLPASLYDIGPPHLTVSRQIPPGSSDPGSVEWHPRTPRSWPVALGHIMRSLTRSEIGTPKRVVGRRSLTGHPLRLSDGAVGMPWLSMRRAATRGPQRFGGSLGAGTRHCEQPGDEAPASRIAASRMRGPVDGRMPKSSRRFSVGQPATGNPPPTKRGIRRWPTAVGAPTWLRSGTAGDGPQRVPLRADSDDGRWPSKPLAFSHNHPATAKRRVRQKHSDGRAPFDDGNTMHAYGNGWNQRGPITCHMGNYLGRPHGYSDRFRVDLAGGLSQHHLVRVGTIMRQALGLTMARQERHMQQATGGDPNSAFWRSRG